MRDVAELHSRARAPPVARREDPDLTPSSPASEVGHPCRRLGRARAAALASNYPRLGTSRQPSGSVALARQPSLPATHGLVPQETTKAPTRKPWASWETQTAERLQ